jgi:hypothetical protein
MPGGLMILLSNGGTDIRCAEAAPSAMVVGTVEGIAVLRRTDCGRMQESVMGRE